MRLRKALLLCTFIIGLTTLMLHLRGGNTRPSRRIPPKKNSQTYGTSLQFKKTISTKRKYQHILKNKSIKKDLSKSVVKGVEIKQILWVGKEKYFTHTNNKPAGLTCDNVKCNFVTHGRFYKSSDAVIFSIDVMKNNLTVPQKLKNQVWIFHAPHPPEKKLTSLIGQWLYKSRSHFNWTLSYRTDANIVVPYGIIRKRKSAYRYDFKKILKSKKNRIAWVTDTCHSKSRRENYVKQLLRYTSVDIYGPCGKIKCKESSALHCVQNLSKKYKFILAFEEDLCQDYITDTFYGAFRTDSVVIARGGGNYGKIAPKGTFVNTADFKSVLDIAQYVNRLYKNSEEYIQYLRRKAAYEAFMEFYPQKGSIQWRYHHERLSVCEVCKRLWNLDKHRQKYKDILKWYDKKQCSTPRDL